MPAYCNHFLSEFFIKNWLSLVLSPVERDVDNTQKSGKRRGNIGSGEQIVLRAERVKDFSEELNLGDTITVELFNDTAYVDVIGTSKGKGFQGVVKRHGFGGVGQTTHGQHNRARKPGSIGACSYPAKVFKGMRMGGQMGGDRVTTHNLQVLKVIPEHNLLLIKGSVPGCKGSIVIIEK